MIAVVHGPIGCGKSTALRQWLERQGWTAPRGYRTFFDASSATLRLASWDGRIDVPIARRDKADAGRRSGAFDPAYPPALHAFLDGVFSAGPERGPCAVQPPVPVVPEKPAGVLAWKLDAPRYWSSALACLSGQASRPLVIDELGALEVQANGFDASAVREMCRNMRDAARAIVVVQERAWPFWKALMATGGERVSGPRKTERAVAQG